MTIQEFIKQRKHLIWYTNNYDGLSQEAIVEATLNYGDFDDVRKLIEILGMQRVAEIFRTQSARPRSNYDQKIKHYFTRYFAKYA